jgi:hypothetical protein
MPQAGPDCGPIASGEIEVTPAMIKAGEDEFWRYDWQYDLPADALPEIFRAMVNARAGAA